jgi:carboxypeptidase PM20D1
MPDEPALARFRELLRIPTVSSHDVGATDWAAFDAFRDAVARLYPGVHAALELERFDRTMLFRWIGRVDGAPSVLLAHYDVVAATQTGWQHEPFAAELSGEGEEAVLWARGVFDDKAAVVGLLEAVESLLAEGFAPEQDVYLLFGHDEETAGSGAAAVAQAFGDRGIRPALVLDEGGAVARGVFPGVSGPVAFVGTAEKQTALLTLTVDDVGGHAASPPRVSAGARLARAVTRLERRPMRPRIIAPVRQLLGALAPAASGPFRPAFAVMHRVPAVLGAVLARLGDEPRAMVRSTIAVTAIEAGHALNAIPVRARATLNVRILPGQGIEEVVAHIRRIVADDRVVVEVIGPTAPSGISPASGPAWERLTRAIRAIFPEAPVAPYLQLGATDSRQFTRLTDAVYRFIPYELSTDERAGMHGTNERMPVASFLRGLAFYETLIRAL